VTEEEFVNSIDCEFPYFDEAKWRAVVKLGSEISPNAAFGVLEEICRPPYGTEVSVQQLEQILDYWRTEFSHPLAESIGDVASLMIKREEISPEEAANLLHIVANYPRIYCALNVPYFACDDKDGTVDKTYKEIIRSWEMLEKT
jgi:hypothetical protein